MGENQRDVEAPFNMAIATLKRLDTILQQIRMLDLIFPRDISEKQKAHIGLVKQFFLNSIPLLDDEDKEIKSYSEEILNLDVPVRVVTISGTQVNQFSYSKEIEVRLNKILIDLQKKLKRYFMPKAKDPGRAVLNY